MDPSDRTFLLIDLSKIAAIAICLLILTSKIGRDAVTVRPTLRAIPMPTVDDAATHYARTQVVIR